MAEFIQNPPRKALLGIFRYSMPGFLGALVFLFVTLPIVEHFDQNDLSESVLLTLVLVSAVLAVGQRRRVLVTSVVLVFPAVVGKWLLHFHQNSLLTEMVFATALLFITFVIFQLLSYILRAPRVNSDVMCAGIAAYLMLGLLWMLAYSFVWRMKPDAFLFTAGPHEMKGSTALYFSFVTLTTVGYGDISPVARVARMLAAAEAMTGTLFLAVMISRLVSLYSGQSSGKPGGGKGGS